MTKSSLAKEVYLAHSNNYQKGRNGYRVCKITPHIMAGKLTAKQCCQNIFQNPNYCASANYTIGYNGEIALNVSEDDRAYTSSNALNDNQAITIEIANIEIGGSWKISDASWNSLVNLCVDICRRYKFKLVYDGTPKGSLTRHNMFANKECPGAYLQSRMAELCKVVNARLESVSSNNTLYKVQIGAFSKKENADKLSKELNSKGIQTYIIAKNNMFKVQCGAYSNVSNARIMAQRLNNMGYETYIEGLNESTVANQGVAYRINCDYPNIRSSASLNASIVRRPKRGDIIYVIGTVNNFLKLSDGTYLKVGFADKI